MRIFICSIENYVCTFKNDKIIMRQFYVWLGNNYKIRKL